MAQRKVWSYSSSIIKMEHIQTGGIRHLSGESDPGAGGLPGGPNTRVLAGADREAADLVGGARIRVGEMLRQAESEAEDIREKARQMGQAEGRRQGYEESLKGVREMVEEMARWREEIRERDRRRWAEMEEELTEMVLQITEKILRQQLQDPETALFLVRDCLGRFSDLSDITLMVSAGDMAGILEQREELEREIPPRTELLILTDESLKDGEFRLRGDEGVFEGTVTDLVSSLRRSFSEERGENRGGM